jgi:hypothetical protein
LATGFAKILMRSSPEFTGKYRNWGGGGGGGAKIVTVMYFYLSAMVLCTYIVFASDAFPHFDATISVLRIDIFVSTM